MNIGGVDSPLAMLILNYLGHDNLTIIVAFLFLKQLKQIGDINNEKRPILSNEASLLVVKEGLEPSTPGLWILCSNQLSYITLKTERAILVFYMPIVKE